MVVAALASPCPCFPPILRPCLWLLASSLYSLSTVRRNIVFSFYLIFPSSLSMPVPGAIWRKMDQAQRSCCFFFFFPCLLFFCRRLPPPAVLECVLLTKTSTCLPGLASLVLCGGAVVSCSVTPPSPDRVSRQLCPGKRRSAGKHERKQK